MKIIKIDQYKLHLIDDILENEGFLRNQIENIKDSYVKFESADDANINMPPMFNFDTYFESLYYLSDFHKHKKTYDKQRLESLKGILKVNNVSPSQARALNFYSSEGERVLAYKRNLSTRESQKLNAKNIFIYKLQCIPSDMQKKQIIYDFMKKNEFEKKNYIDVDKVENEIEHLDIEKEQKYVICDYIYTLTHILSLDKNIKYLDQCLKNQIVDNLIVYRGISSSFLYKLFPDKVSPLSQNFASLVGEKIEEKGYLSTSSYIGSSFAHFPKNDIILEIFAPRGSQGFDISPFSNFTYENELLFNSCDLFILGNKDIKHVGEQKTLLSCLLISKERECYKNLNEIQVQSQDIRKIYEGVENA